MCVVHLEKIKAEKPASPLKAAKAELFALNEHSKDNHATIKVSACMLCTLIAYKERIDRAIVQDGYTDFIFLPTDLLADDYGPTEPQTETDKSHLKELLKTNSNLTYLGADEELENKLIQAMKQEQYKASERIISAADQWKHFYIIERGM